jgi:hypothetical protein
MMPYPVTVPALLLKPSLPSCIAAFFALTSHNDEEIGTGEAMPFRAMSSLFAKQNVRLMGQWLKMCSTHASRPLAFVMQFPSSRHISNTQLIADDVSPVISTADGERTITERLMGSGPEPTAAQPFIGRIGSALINLLPESLDSACGNPFHCATNLSTKGW